MVVGVFHVGSVFCFFFGFALMLMGSLCLFGLCLFIFVYFFCFGFRFGVLPLVFVSGVFTFLLVIVFWVFFLFFYVVIFCSV